MTDSTRARAYWSIRSAHLERAHEWDRATIVYGKANYDFDQSLTQGLDLIHAPTGRAAASILRAMPQLATVEVNEPLGLSSLKWTVPIVAALRLRRGARIEIVCYAIENLDPFLPAPQGAKARVKRGLERRAARFVAGQIDRVAWGTSGSQELYEEQFGHTIGRRRAVIPALPNACQCLITTGRKPDPVNLLFVGTLTPRKGFDRVLAAWPTVAAAAPSATLTIVGKGSGEVAALELAATDDRVTVLIDPPRAEVHARLRAATALVLLSQRTPRWREQVGLPIVEALSHGCEVVTTSETGLAAWLSDHGHRVVSPQASDESVAAAITGALNDPRPPAEILSQLPTEDGRLVADRWLFA